MWFLREDSGWSDLILARGQICPGKGSKKSQRAKRKFWSQQVLFGTKFLKFYPKRADLATLVVAVHSLTPALMLLSVDCDYDTILFVRIVHL